MSEYSTNDEDADELPDLRVDEDTSSSTRSGTEPTDGLLDPTTKGNSFIATSPYGDDIPLDLRTTPVKTIAKLLEVPDLRTSPVRNRSILLADIVDPSPTLPTRDDDHDAPEQTSACSVSSDPCIIASDGQIEPSVCFPTGKDDSGVPGILNTISPQQYPVSTSVSRRIADELFNPRHVGSWLGTSPDSPTVGRAQTTTTKTYRLHPYQRKDDRAVMKPISCSNSTDSFMRLKAGILRSTSQTFNRTEMRYPNIVGEPKFDATGQNRWLVNSTNPHNPSFGDRPLLMGPLVVRPSECVGDVDPGPIPSNSLYDVDTGEPIYHCDICGNQYQWLTRFNRHLSKNGVHNLPVKCNLCGDTHIGEKKFACEFCDMKFWHEKDMEWHRAVHADVKPFRCPRCGAGFWKKRLFVQHLRAGTRLL